jgi:Tfp pilus assembly protein PilN
LYTKETNDDASVFIIKNGYVCFSRAIPTRFIAKNKLKVEVEKIKTAFEAYNDFASSKLEVKSIEKVTVKTEYSQFKNLHDRPSDWLVALGAAIRGSIPNGDDSLISLLPVKTEEAYKYQKAVTFIILLRNVTIGIAFFFTLSLFAMYFVMLSLSQTANQSIASLSSAPVSSELLSHEARVKNVNELTATAKLVLSETPLWSTFLEEFSVRIIPGITITNLSAQSITGEITLTGSAQDRITLNQYKKSLQESPLFESVELPITNLEQKENIAFSMTFKLKDPPALYYK